MKNTFLCASLVAAAALLSPALQAQDAPLSFPQASPGATVSQRVGLTDIEIKYSRPGAKGRAIFGGLVPFGEVWRTGANAATKISFSTDAKLGGQAVPAGTYSLFTIPEAREWTIILNKVPDQSGAFAYDAAQDLLRVKAAVVALPAPVESFTIGVDELSSHSAMLTLAWEKTAVRVPIEIDVVGQLVPKIKAAMAGDGPKPYLQAAMFYYDNDLDLAQATQWIEAAIKEQPEPPTWMVYRHGLILKKAGDKAGALASAKWSLELAEKAGGELGAEYKRLNEELIASLK
ncbi:MAG TPA: DUF2911 domain-containing protein [Planctomycetota bacterium]|nr:DUF2911 domain-containing protein [Planctomycetota bacterium]